MQDEALVRKALELLTVQRQPVVPEPIQQPEPVPAVASPEPEVLVLEAPCLVPPVNEGWHVCWRDRSGRLRGGFPDPEGRVQEVTFQQETGRWLLTVGQEIVLPLRAVVSVGRTDANGKLVAAWLVKDHGFDGEGREADATQ